MSSQVGVVHFQNLIFITLRYLLGEMVHTNQKKICKYYKKQNKFTGNSRKWVYSKCAEFWFDRTMEGVSTDMENGFWPKLWRAPFNMLFPYGQGGRKYQFQNIIVTLGEEEGGWRPWVELLLMTLDFAEWFIERINDYIFWAFNGDGFESKIPKLLNRPKKVKNG
jgi:hypothetical protein